MNSLCFIMLYERYCQDLTEQQGDIFKQYYLQMKEDYTKENDYGKIAVDFMAGMTDKFFVNQFEKNFLPKIYDLTI